MQENQWVSEIRIDKLEFYLAIHDCSAIREGHNQNIIERI